jgi:hypothetical protein
MESIIRNVRDIDTSERQVLEHVLGQKLGENQQLIFQIVTIGKAPTQATTPPQAANGLPDWCNVFEGLSDDEIADLDVIVGKRADLSRPPE